MHNATKISPLGYRSDIDGLRALAVSAVVAYHADFRGFGGGFIGVDVFFVISGFLITQHLSNELQKSGKIRFSEFYAKRIRRLFPALSLTVFFTLLIWILFFAGIPSETRPFLKSIRYSLFGLANIFFKNNTGGYFDGPSAEMPLLHFWSLAVEEQFYLVWPLLLFCTYRIGKLKGVLVGLFFVGFVSLGVSEYWIRTQRVSQAFYWMPSRAWELALGGCLAFIDPSKWFLGSGTASIVSVTGAMLILYSVINYTSQTVFPGTAAILPAVGAFLLILCGQKSQPVSRVFSSKLAVKIGILSYGWYLWHWPLLAFGRVYYMGARPPLAVRCALIVLALLLAEVSLRWVEKPLRFGKKILELKPYEVMVRAFCVAGIICLFAWAVVENERNLIPKERRKFLELTEERVSLYADCVDRLENRFNEKCEKSFVRTGANSADSQVILWGDSHGFSYFPMLEEYAKTHFSKAHLLARSRVLPLLGDRVWFDDEIRSREINDLNKSGLDFIRKTIESSRLKVSVVLAARWMQRSGKKPISILDDPLFLDRKGTFSESMLTLESALKETINRLNAVGVDRILVLLPYPEFKYPVLRCHVRHYPFCDTPRTQMEDYRKEVVEVIHKIVSQYPNVKILDPVDSLCNAQTCPQVITVDGQETPVVFDGDHPSVAAAKLLGEKNRLVLDWLTRNDKE
jgi:peptidoglycan/LPS O-acetylase OafA/YrhL